MGRVSGRVLGNKTIKQLSICKYRLKYEYENE